MLFDGCEFDAEDVPARITKPLGPGDRPCKSCGGPAVEFGSFCTACYGEWLHPQGLPMVPGDPDDPWRAYNAEADAYILDQRMPKRFDAPAVPRPPRQAPMSYDDE